MIDLSLLPTAEWRGSRPAGRAVTWWVDAVCGWRATCSATGSPPAMSPPSVTQFWARWRRRRPTRGLGRRSASGVDRLDLLDRQLLHERHLVSRELAAPEPGARARPGGGLLIQDQTSVMVNEEDHLRLQTLQSGFALDAAWGLVATLDTELGQRLGFAFHPEFGYLTSCPTNVGTGLRASVLVHLPGLVLTKEINKSAGAHQVGLTFRGSTERREVVGNLFQLFEQTTLEIGERMLDQLASWSGRSWSTQERARQILLRDATAILEDRCGGRTVCSLRAHPVF